MPPQPFRAGAAAYGGSPLLSAIQAGGAPAAPLGGTSAGNAANFNLAQSLAQGYQQQQAQRPATPSLAHLQQQGYQYGSGGTVYNPLMGQSGTWAGVNMNPGDAMYTDSGQRFMGGFAGNTPDWARDFNSQAGLNFRNRRNEQIRQSLL